MIMQQSGNIDSVFLHLFDPYKFSVLKFRLTVF